MLGKFAAVIGPFMIGLVTVTTGSNRIGMLSILILFLLGAVLLRKVDEEEGKKMVQEYLEGNK
jgi:UMF1 family MFS transporter